MYFSQFDSFESATTKSTSFVIVVERVDGKTVTSSPIPIKCLEDGLGEVADAEGGAAIHLWQGADRSMVIIPQVQIAAIRVQFQ